MKNLKKAKKIYNSIKIPEHLNYVVNRAIANNSKPKYHIFKYFNYAVSTVTCTFIAFVLLINTNSSFASNIAEIPIVGDIAKIFTVKEVKEEDSTKLINAKIPALENTGNTDLEKRINYEIMLKINEILEEAEKRAAEYKNAVIETGGTEES